MDRNKIIQKGVRHIAEEYGCTVDEVNAILDQHPIEINRDLFLKRTLAAELVELDELQAAVRDKAGSAGTARDICRSRWVSNRW